MSKTNYQRERQREKLVAKTLWEKHFGHYLKHLKVYIISKKKVRKVPSYGRKRLLGNAATTPPLSRSEIYLFFGWVFK